MKEIKFWYLAVFLFVIPFAVVGVLHFGNFINDAIPKLNINPNGIGNEQWFLFLAAYLGGVCTLLAVYITLQANQWAVNDTLQANQRASYYQAEVLAIANEAKVISDVLSSFQLLFVNKVFTEFQVISIENGTFDSVQISSLLKSIIDEREKITKYQIKLSLETMIYQDYCKVCKNRENCNKGKVAMKFADKYKIFFEKLYTSLNDLQNFVFIHNTNLKSKKFIYDCDNLLKNPTGITEDNINLCINNRELAENQIKDPAEALAKVESHIPELNTLRDVQMKKLINLSKTYIGICRENARLRMQGKQVPKHEFDVYAQAKKEV